MAVDIKGSLVVLDPTVEPAPASARMAPRPNSLEGTRIGLLDNGKPHARELLEHVERLLEERFQPAQVIRFRKPNASKPASGDLIVDIARQVDAVVNGVGD